MRVTGEGGVWRVEVTVKLLAATTLEEERNFL
jgi:hypothetical protein